MTSRGLLVAIICLLPSVSALAAPPKDGEPETTNKFRMCTGLPGGNYEFVGIAMQRQLPQHIVGVTTKGSLENMERVDSGDCQGAIVQSDAYFVYMQKHPSAQINIERARDMYPEYGHLICNKSIKELSDLTNKNVVLVGPPGSGSSVMWDAIVSANPKKYKDVQTLPLGGTRALSKVTDGMDAQCMLFVAGLKSPAMMDANSVAKNSNGNLHLTYMRDPALFDIKDSKGRPVYEKASIPDGTYPDGLQNGGWFTSGAIDTVKVQSVFIDNVPWADSHSQPIDQVLSAVNKAMPAINQRVLAH